MIPSPYTFSPTDRFDGVDGKWTSFYLNVGAKNDTGTGGQDFRVLISTSAALTVLPAELNWCNTDACAEKRGLEIFKSRRPRGFEAKETPDYNVHGQYSMPKPYGWPGSQWNETNDVNGAYGFTTVGLGKGGANSKMLTGRLVSATEFKDYFIGQFGLGIESIASSGAPTPAFLPVFAERDMIPSTSYAYAVGAHYRRDNRGFRGSLILGGYDKSRFQSDKEQLSVPFPESNSTLLVNVRSLSYTPDRNKGSGETFFTVGTSTPTFYAAIDSTFPYLWLPSEVCDKIKEQFNLNYDEQRNMYFLNQTQHESNMYQNGTINFVLSENPSQSRKTAAIELPYAAFDQFIDTPLYSNATRYFPMKKSKNGMYILGRTFLQEAYLIVDYDNRNFTVAPTVWPDPIPSASTNVVPIYSKKWKPSNTPSSSTPGSTPASSSSGLSGGAIAGIVVGILVALGFLGLGAFFHWKKRRTHHYKDKADSESDPIQPSDLVKYGRSLDPGAELPGSPTPDYYGRETKDGLPFPRLPELESPPVEMYSPPLETATPATGATGEGIDYFKIRRRRATRESSGNNTPGTPGIPELAGDDGKFTVDGQHFEPVQSPVVSPIMSPLQSPTPSHHRGPSDTSLQTNIDEVMAQGAPPKSRSQSPSPHRPSASATSAEAQVEDQRPRDASPGISPDATLDRRPSHTRGLSEITVRSDSTGVSNPSPEEVEIWNKNKNEPMRPLSE